MYSCQRAWLLPWTVKSYCNFVHFHFQFLELFPMILEPFTKSTCLRLCPEMFSLRSFIISGLTLRSPTQFLELVFVQDVIYGFGLILLQMAIQCSQHYWFKGLYVLDTFVQLWQHGFVSGYSLLVCCFSLLLYQYHPIFVFTDVQFSMRLGISLAVSDCFGYWVSFVFTYEC